MEDPNSIRVLWDIHGMRADVLEEREVIARLSCCTFFLQSMKKTEWKLCFFTSCHGVHVLLDRISGGEPERIELDYDIHLLKSDGSMWKKSNKGRKVFGNGDSQIKTLATRQDLLDNSKVLMDSGVVRVSARLWPVGFSLPHPLTLCVKSRAGVLRRVLWNVEKISRILGGEEREYDLDMHINMFGDNKLILFLLEGKVCVRIKGNFDTMSVILCESVSIIQNEDSLNPRLLCWEGCKLLKQNDPNHYLAFLDAERLTTDLSAFVQNDELKVFFQLIDYSTYMIVSASEVIEGAVGAIERPGNVVSSNHKGTKLISPFFEALQTQSRGVNTDDSLERGHPDCPFGSDFQSLLQEETFSDFKLKIGNESIAVHKAVLCARSPVLKAMLEAPMQESCNNEMNVPDFHPDTVRRLVRFLYSGSVPDLDPSTALELYEAADKYAVFALRALCSRAMVSGLGVSNVCEVLSLSDRHQDEDFKGKVIEFIQTHKKEVFMSQEWSAFMKDETPLACEVFFNFEMKKYSS